jgi:hypothetical protein
VSVEGRTVRFVVKGNDQGSTFAGVIAADGRTMAGEVKAGDYAIPFTLTRIGEARIAKAPVSPPVSKELEGIWHGTIAADGKDMRLEVRMTNQPDGTSRGVIASPTGSGIEVPMAVLQTGNSVLFDIEAVGASFRGELNADATEVKGTWTQNTATLALTLVRPQR